MKKVKNLFILLLITLVLSGCSFKKTASRKVLVTEGKYYNIVSLQDKGIDMFRSIIPKGWTASIKSQDLVNSAQPFIETVEITNSDSSAKITILSQHSFVDNKNYSEGENRAYYTTYFRKMNAKEYSDYFMEKVYNTNSFVTDIEVDSDMYSELDVLHNLRIELGKQDAKLLEADNYDVNITVNGVDKTASKRQYKNGENYYEIFTAVSAVSSTLTSSLDSLLNSTSVQWYMPFVIVYEAETKETFDAYYDDYNLIVANSNFTLDYYAMIEYASSAIVNAVTSAYSEKFQAGLRAMDEYIDSNYSSTSSATTNDKVMEMWDDVIKEVDSYKMEDGTTVKTSIFNDTVAQNGNELYVGPKAGIPYGFNELSKSY